MSRDREPISVGCLKYGKFPDPLNTAKGLVFNVDTVGSVRAYLILMSREESSIPLYERFILTQYQ